MSYRADKPFGRRKTDKEVSSAQSRHWRRIRRDVDEDTTGTLRRYLRLSEKVLGPENEREHPTEHEQAESLHQELTRKRAA